MEAWDKYMRAFNSGVLCRARQSAVDDNLQDVFTRMLDMIYPKVVNYMADFQCFLCEENGHTSRSCVIVERPQNEEDAVISKFYL